LLVFKVKDKGVISAGITKQISLSFLMVAFETTPVPLVKPLGLNISSAYFSWKAITAFLVFSPKVPVISPLG